MANTKKLNYEELEKLMKGEKVELDSNIEALELSSDLLTQGSDIYEKIKLFNEMLDMDEERFGNMLNILDRYDNEEHYEE